MICISQESKGEKMLTKIADGVWFNNDTGETCSLRNPEPEPEPKLKLSGKRHKIAQERRVDMAKYYQQGLTPVQIGKLMGLSPKTVYAGLYHLNIRKIKRR